MQWENVYIFISSTFNDMHAERDYLVKSVFPELAGWCEARKLRLIDIDLRWGVREEDTTVNKNTVKVCLDRIDECRPFFLCFLGQRRGWVPQDGDVSDETKRHYPQIGDYIGNMSITEMEIEHALINPLRKLLDGRERLPMPVEHAFFFLRNDAYLQDLPRPLRAIYTNEHIADEAGREQADGELAAWKEKIRRRNHADYAARWDAAATTPELKSDDAPGLEQGRLVGFESGGEALKDMILRKLKQAIGARFPQHRPSVPMTEYDIDIEQQQQFIALNKDGFIARAGDFDSLNEYVAGGSDALFVLTAPAGTGKSMLLANFAAYQPVRTVARFIGASDKSTSVYSLWRSIFYELGRDVPSSPKELMQRLPALLQEAGREQKTVIILDALNQLDTGLADLGWLPHTLPEGIKLIVSFKSGSKDAENAIAALDAAGKAVIRSVPPFDSEGDKRAIIDAYLNQYLKALDEKHIRTICSMPGSENPLFLKILLSELRVFGSFAQLGELITKQFGNTPLTAFSGVLARLEQDTAYGALPPERAVPYLFGLLCCARRGLSERELALCFQSEFPQTGEQEIQGTIRLYFRQMRLFLARRENRTDFLYESLALAARERYTGSLKRLNGRLADAFRLLCDTGADDTFREEDPRALAEYAWHTRQHDWAAAGELYQNLAYLHARCSAGGSGDLLPEMDDMAEDAPAIAPYGRLLYRFAEDLQHFPNLLFSIAHYEGFDAIRRQAEALLPKWDRPWLRVRRVFEAPAVEFAAAADGVSITVEKRMTLPNTVAAQFVAERDVALYTEGLGCVRVLHTDTMAPDPNMIRTRAVRPLQIYCAADGAYAAVAFEDMTADVLAVHYNEDGSLAYAEAIAVIDYLLPLYDDGVLLFDGDALYYQEREDAVVCAKIKGGALEKTLLPLPRPGELSAAARAGNGVCFAVRCYDDTDIVCFADGAQVAHAHLEAADVACAAATGDGGVVFSLRDGMLAAYDALLNKTASANAGHAMMAMCDVGGRLFALTELYNKSFEWDYANEPAEGGNEWLGRSRTACLKPYADGSMLFLSDRMAVRFSTGGARAADAPELVAAFEEAPGSYIAVGKSAGQMHIYNKTGAIALDGMKRDSEPYALHTRGEIAVLDNTGHGYVANSDDLCAGRLAMGGEVVSIAASDIGHYYIYSSAGLLRQQPEGAPMPDILGYRLASVSLYAYDDMLVLLGISDDAKAGIEHKNYIALFYRMQPGGRLVACGERYFDTEMGNFITMTKDGDRYYILFATPNIGSRAAHPILRYGSLQDFIGEGEQAAELPISKQHVNMCCKENTLYICAGGMLYAYDKNTLAYRTAASATETFRMVAQTSAENTEALATEGKNILTYIKAEGSDLI